VLEGDDFQGGGEMGGLGADLPKKSICRAQGRFCGDGGKGNWNGKWNAVRLLRKWGSCWRGGKRAKIVGRKGSSR